jgi:hypothetical protein
MAKRRKRPSAATPAGSRQADRVANTLLTMAHVMAAIKSLASHARAGVAAPAIVLDDCGNKLAECFVVFRSAHEKPTAAK